MSVPAEIQEVSTGALTISEEVKMIAVKDAESLTRANEGFLLIRKMRKAIAAVFDPMEDKAKEAKKAAEENRKEIVNQRAKVEAPLVAAEFYLNGQIGDYKREQDRIRQAEEDRLRKIAIEEETKRRKEEEARKMAEAQALEAAGAHEEAEQMMVEAIQAVEEPITVKVEAPPKIILNGMTERTTWHADVYDLKALCLAVGQGKASPTFVKADMTNLDKQAVSLKSNLRIPGVKAVSESKMVPTGR